MAGGISFLTTWLIARYLGPEKYGELALILSYPLLLRSVGAFKSLSVTTRYLSSYRSIGDKKKFQSMAKIGYFVDFFSDLLIFGLVVLTGSWVSSRMYNDSDLYWPMVLYASSYPFLAWRGGSVAILTALEDFEKVSVLFILEKMLSLILVGGALSLRWGIWGVVLALAMSNLLSGGVALFLATQRLVKGGWGVWWKGSLREVALLRRELLAFFGWNYLITTLSGAVSQIPVMLLGTFRGKEEAGFFRLAFSVMTVASYIPNAAQHVVYPWLSSLLAQGNRQNQIRNLVRSWTLKQGIALGIFMLILIPAISTIVPWTLGERYRAMLYGLQIILLFTVVKSVFFWVTPYYYSTGQIRSLTQWFLVAVMLLVSTGFWVASAWGFVGMSFVYTITQTLYFLILAYGAMNRTAVFSLNRE